MHPALDQVPGEGAVAAGQGVAVRLELPLLRRVEGLFHAFTLRGSDPGAVLQAIAGRSVPLRSLRQVHGAAVHLVDAGDSSESPQGDALVCARAGIAVGVFVADCVPVLICDPVRRVVAAAHAGWRGTVAGVLRAAIATMRQACGVRPGNLIVGFGPAIGPCCFKVGDEVVSALLGADPGARDCVLDGAGGRRIDLVAANRRQAILTGVPEEQVEAAGLCTCCGGERFESYRAGGGRAGRMAALAGWRSPL